MNSTVARTTVVARIRSSLVVHETLFISASVAIRKSANGGKWMSRKITQPRAAANSRGSPNRQSGRVLHRGLRDLVGAGQHDHAQAQAV